MDWTIIESFNTLPTKEMNSMKLYHSVACFITALIIVINAPPSFAADLFDQHTEYWLQQVSKSGKPMSSLSQDEANSLKPLSPTLTSPCIVIQTNAGNWSKAMLAWGYRKGNDKPTPVLLFERYVTYDSIRQGRTTAAGKDVMLFAGFQFNFDIGQVVPDGQGGDLKFTPDGTIEAVGNAKLYVLNGSQLPKPKNNESKTVQPADRKGVLSQDFSGTWDINVDGRWKGEWTILVEANGRGTGRYLSYDTRSHYEVRGRKGLLPHNMKFSIQHDNSIQTFDAFLWTKDKSTLAGTSTIAGRTFGFFARRVKKKAASKPNSSP